MTNKRNIVAFAGRARSGKGELSNMLAHEHGAVIITVANYLKYLCCDILNVSYDELNMLKNDGTELNLKPDERWVKIIHNRTGIDAESLSSELDGMVIPNVRQMLQVVGTDIIRKYNPTWHVDCMVKDILSYPEDKLIAVDDVRFPNEKQAIEELGGKVFFIVRPKAIKEVSNHPSETALRWTDFDYDRILINDSTLDYFKVCFLALYNNGFDLYCDILLSCNPQYIDMNMQYGNIHVSDELFYFIKRSIDSTYFSTYGAMRFVLLTDELKRTFYEEVLNKRYVNDEYDEYILYNPIITENFKLFLGK